MLSLLQRQRNQILACLADGDASIRQRAMRVALILLPEAAKEVAPRLLEAMAERGDHDFDPRLGREVAMALIQMPMANDGEWYLSTVSRLLGMWPEGEGREAAEAGDAVVTALLNRVPRLGNAQQLELFLSAAGKQAPSTLWLQAAYWYTGLTGSLEQLASIKRKESKGALSYLIVAMGRLGDAQGLRDLAQRHSQDAHLVQLASEQLAMLEGGIANSNLSVVANDGWKNPEPFDLSQQFRGLGFEDRPVRSRGNSQIDEGTLGQCVYRQHSLCLFVRLESLSPTLTLRLSLYHTLAIPLPRLSLQVAVPRNQQAQLSAPDDSQGPLRPHTLTTQMVTIEWREGETGEPVTPAEVRLRIRLEVELPLSSAPLVEIINHQF